MNGFIDEVVTQGTLMQEVGRYYRGAGLQSIQAIVAAYQERLFCPDLFFQAGYCFS